jgi:hypothetical protein
MRLPEANTASAQICDVIAIAAENNLKRSASIGSPRATSPTPRASRSDKKGRDADYFIPSQGLAARTFSFSAGTDLGLAWR